MFDETELEEMAVEVIYNYYNGKYSKEYIKGNFSIAIKLLKAKADNLYNNSRVGVTSISEGNQSITYAESTNTKLTIDSSIAQFLPRKANIYAW